MLLSGFALNEGESLLRDGAYDVMGILSARHEKKMLSFMADLKYMGEVQANRNVSCIICKKEMAALLPEHVAGVILSDDPVFCFWRLHNEQGEKRKRFKTVIGQNCRISPLAHIAPENVRIGDNAVIEEFASIKENTRIGDNVIIRAGCIVGGQGFEFKAMDQQPLYPVEHWGGVSIEDGVELQQLNNVSRAVFAWDDTVIGAGTKTDALVHIAHADKIGKQCRLTAGVTIGGSTRIGDRVWLGLNAVICPQAHVGDDAFVCMGAIVAKDVDNGQKVSGNFAMDHTKQMDFEIVKRRLLKNLSV